MSPDVDLVLMDRDRLLRSLKRMAHEIAEQNIKDRPVILFGINERGHAIAGALGEILQPLFEKEVAVIQLLLKNEDVDERDQAFERFRDMGVENPFIIVVDDVIFSGQTMFSALKEITERVDPSEIHTAVLIDRGHRKFPVKAEYYGMELPTKLNEHVAVVVENKNVGKVVLSKTEK